MTQVTQVQMNQCWVLKSPLKARVSKGTETVRLPAFQGLITIAVSQNGAEVEFTAQGRYFVAKVDNLATTGIYEHDWL